ncbi:unnamed protein product [Taenia asiatica]|uniref:Pecanex-like protein n=1 Tax=Taenia asiatica TaxID=60517 RepID=A0A0R3WEE9_TAEAS|nr:unnamed protein product [Taenia asiatica]
MGGHRNWIRRGPLNPQLVNHSFENISVEKLRYFYKLTSPICFGGESLHTWKRNKECEMGDDLPAFRLETLGILESAARLANFTDRLNRNSCAVCSSLAAVGRETASGSDADEVSSISCGSGSCVSCSDGDDGWGWSFHLSSRWIAAPEAVSMRSLEWMKYLAHLITHEKPLIMEASNTLTGLYFSAKAAITGKSIKSSSVSGASACVNEVSVMDLKLPFLLACEYKMESAVDCFSLRSGWNDNARGVAEVITQSWEFGCAEVD